MQHLKIAINGACGRMGQNLVRAIAATPNLTLGAALEHATSDFIGIDAGVVAGIGAQNVVIGCDLPVLIDDFDVLIDFSRPAPCLAALELCVAYHKPMVIGTTGFDSQERDTIVAASEKLPIVLAANYSIGVNVLLKLLEVAAKTMGQNVDVEISELHHRHKVDAPSGTALTMGTTIAQAWGKDLSQLAVYERHSHKAPRQEGSIGFACMRAGEVVGEHSAIFAAMGERLEISHKADDRAIYAAGALRAASWLATQGAGLFNMQDVLSLGSI